jgi:hypothetical protein
VLARLVAQLAVEQTGALADIVLRQAVEIAPKLTKRQMNALNVILLFPNVAKMRVE